MGRKDDFMRLDILEMRKMENFICEDCLEDEEMSAENFEKGLEQALDESLKSTEWNQYFEEICTELDNVTKTSEKQKFKIVMEEISGIIKNKEKYWGDLCTDIYMGILRADKENDICYNALGKTGWDMRSCNKRVSIETAKKHYPLTDYVEGDFITEGIPGGCREYHKLMMKQRNLGFFDFESEKKSLKQYAYPKAHNIYIALSDSPIENLLLLEKTQGIGFTNQIFPYVMEITKKEQLEKLEEIIKPMAEIPMFIRQYISNKILEYLYNYDYNEESVRCVKDNIDVIRYAIKCIYERMWKYSWHKLKEGRFPIYDLKGAINVWWKGYFSEYEIREYFESSMGLYGWQEVEKYRNQDTGDEKVVVWNGLLRGVGNNNFLIDMDKRGEEFIKVFDKKINKDRYRGGSVDSDNLWEGLLEETSRELEKQEDKKWEKVDPKRDTKNLSPMDVYAMIHFDIVKVLNK